MSVSGCVQIISKGNIIRSEFKIKFEKAITLKQVIKKVGKLNKVKLDKLLTKQNHITILINNQPIDYNKNLDLEIINGDMFYIMQQIFGG